MDKSGTAIAGANIKLSRADQSELSEAQSDSDGQFCVSNVPAGAFQLSISSDGFAPQNFSGIVQPGQTYMAPNIVLSVASIQTELRVGVSPFEVAEQQVKDEEKQRLLGAIPMFYVSYVPDAAPLNSKQKLELAWKTLLDPFTFGLAAAAAGIEQETNAFSGYGRGAQGFGKRFGAAYADNATDTIIGGAILPILLKQDPRYFYKGTGSVHSRFLYAIANSVICKGDNRRWQPNYSGIIGSLAASGMSNLYYPPENRGVQLTFENALIGIGESAAFNVIQEFIFPKLTSHRADRQAAKSSTDLSAE